MKPWGVKGKDVTYNGRVMLGFDSSTVAAHISCTFNDMDAFVKEWQRVTYCRVRYDRAEVSLDIRERQYELELVSTGVNVTDSIEGRVLITVSYPDLSGGIYGQCAREIERISLLLRDRQRPAIPVYIPRKEN